MKILFGVGIGGAKGRVLKTQLKLVICFFACCALLAFGLSASVVFKAGLADESLGVQVAELDKEAGCDWVARDLHEVLVPALVPAKENNFTCSQARRFAMSAGFGEVAQPSGGISTVLLSRPPPTTL